MRHRKQRPIKPPPTAVTTISVPFLATSLAYNQPPSNFRFHHDIIDSTPVFLSDSPGPFPRPSFACPSPTPVPVRLIPVSKPGFASPDSHRDLITTAHFASFHQTVHLAYEHQHRQHQILGHHQTSNAVVIGSGSGSGSLCIDEHAGIASFISDLSPAQTSPTHASAPRGALSPASTTSNVSPFRDRLSDFANYRRDLAVLETSGGRLPSIHQQPPTATPSSNSQVAPWMSPSNGGATASTPQTQLNTTFYNDSSDNLSIASQLSPGFRPPTNRIAHQSSGSQDSPDAAYFADERRPSLASITTLSSQGSKTSIRRGGLQKLQGFFGEEFPGRDGSESSLHSSSGKDRSRSYSHSRPTRDRNYSNATDHPRDREGSPSSSRPRTPVPAPEVVPFLYQEADDIARYGEAPVRDILSGPDRERYMNNENPNNPQNPPKTSSSSRSGHSIVHLPGHHHRHNKSIDDGRALRPTVSREDSQASLQVQNPRERGGSAATVMYNSNRSRAQSPTPSGGYFNSRHNPSVDGSTSPGGQQQPHHHSKRNILNRLRGRKQDKDDGTSRLRELPGSTRSLAAKPSRTDFARPEMSPSTFPLNYAGTEPGPDQDPRLANYNNRNQTFNNRFPFSKSKGRQQRPTDIQDEQIGPTDRQAGGSGTVFHLDTNLNDMKGILTEPKPLTPMDNKFIQTIVTRDEPPPVPAKPEALPQGGPNGANGAWNAPDSWAVRRNTEDTTYQPPEIDDIGSPPRPEEKMTPYCIRIFRSDGTFATLSMALDASVTDVISQLIKKTYATDGLENYHIILKKHDLVRVLSAAERPLLMQKRLLQQIGYEEKDKIEDVGREDNSYLCRFMFLSSRESDFHSVTNDLGLGRIQKFNHVDLSGRNLITIPISLYSKAGDIISLNLSRNLSLDLPRDFIQSCQNLRDIKFNNNEARRLPPSLAKAARLTYLDVSNNRVEQLDSSDLDGLHGILKLNMANNRLKALPAYFGAYRALRNLNISSNFLDQFPLFLCNVGSLVELDLSFNNISSLPNEIGKLQNLEKLVMTNNRLSGSMPSSFRQLTALRELDIKYNAINSIDIISELPKLEILSADHNYVSQFVGSFERIRSLKLNSNPVTKFEINEPVLTLKMLNLSHCQLASIDETFNMMLNLERLVLDKNYFVSLPAQIGNLSKLEHFSIANNNVAELPTSIGCLTELRVLDVRRNNIRKLPMELWWAHKLETLNASSNILENFPKPASRQPRPAGEEVSTPSAVNKANPMGSLPPLPPIPYEESVDSRRPSQNSSSTLLSVGPSPVPGGGDRKGSVVSVYGKGGRKTSVVSRSTSQGTVQTMTPPSVRKDSSLSSRLSSTFAGSLRNLYLAENKLDDEVFDQITMLNELRVLNLSWNYINDMPQRSIKSWPQMVELYLSGNELTTLPADDLEDASLLQVLHINGNKFTNLPADISRAKKLAVLDCGSNSLKYNISNVPYDWNWNLNPNLRYLNLSGNKRLEIKQTVIGPTAANREQLADFSRLLNLRVLGLMDVTLTQPTIPDQSEDRRVRTSGSLAGHLPYGMADTLGKNEHLSTIDLVVPRFNSSETETLLGLFDGQALSSGGSKIAKYLHENFGHIFSMELKSLKTNTNSKTPGTAVPETPADALRRAFLSLNKDLVTIAIQHTEERSQKTHRGSVQPVVLSKEDLNSGGVATVVYLQNTDLYVANVGDAQAMVIQTDGTHKILTRKHDPAEPTERQRIREAGGWVSRNGRLNDLLEVSRAFGYVELMPAVQAAPYVSHIAIKEQDDIVLIATREFWEYLDPALVVDFARQERSDLMRASQKLRDLAIAYGATNKIMVMMMSVADLKRRVERSRLHRGQSMSLYPSGIPDDLQQPLRRGKRNKGDVLDSTLQRLEAEIPAPTGNVSIAFTDIKNSTTLWEMYPAAMRSAIKLHNEVMRRQLRRIGGYEVKTEGDAFMVSFPTATSALLWCFAVQMSLLEVNWPSEVLNSVSCQALYDKDNAVIFKGLSVRMGIHYGEAVSEMDPVTRRMDYFGPMVNKAARISSVADGGQITVSSDFISEVQRCLETYQDTERNGSTGSEDTFDDDGGFAASIRKDLRSLSSQGFEVKEMGEKKLKGLENPEMVYSLYPHALAGRIEHHQQHETTVADKPAILQAGSELAFDTESIWALWRVSLRLEMLCSSLENVSGRGLQPPETELLERMKHRGGEVTERFLLNFMEHQVSRIETCVTSLSLRHIVIGNAPLAQLDDLRAPMNDILDSVAKQMAELARYKALYGELTDEDHGSDTEQE
ncbi:protein phosphatase 2C [Colletotrichum karsti]|uniref:Adenylate cyclase n=1 Tax=Colletotrichum karsti TaxID=1095194 RepID=A0A9P6LNM8_9PEZI|nr:protein phosphatase 2C [Colletotrichum karsti]KAF9879780.1 protein phosphatase 2C [Colletotrichum karsti]